MKKWIPVGVLVLVVGLYLSRSLNQPSGHPSPESAPTAAAPLEPETAPTLPTPKNFAEADPSQVTDFEVTENKASVEAATFHQQTTPEALTYVMEDGVAVVNEDIVIGVPRSAKMRGSVSLESLQLWPDGVVPFHIQGDLENKERVIQAIAMFVDTPVKFIPYTNQADVLVFETGSGCKSYLGKVGGQQPVWISPACSSRDIAHEIMHALGFIHEQNRSDRDRFVNIIWDNIQDDFRHNFELFPQSLMLLSGQTAFDFESIMLYQATAFGKNGHDPTMTSKVEGKMIAPSATLSASDMERLERVYGTR